MKYMGSKRMMLMNGLGEAIAAEMPRARRFADLFTGSGVVAWYAATRWDAEVIACDLQHFAVALAASVVSRDMAVHADNVLMDWVGRARAQVETHPTFADAIRLQNALDLARLKFTVEASRELCHDPSCGPVQSAYGGFYFSPVQSLWIDCLRATLPQIPNAQTVALAALIQASSRCAAAPGHTAQPFQPNSTAGPFLIESWSKDILDLTMKNFVNIGACVARRRGMASVGDATALALTLREGDLAFIDPPYSAVHYSRFYHVLETIARGERVEVSGTGRYPPRDVRPQSSFSLKTGAKSAFQSLLKTLGRTGARAIITFPAGKSSNGLSGKLVAEIASDHFRIEREVVTSRFSTLGGNRIIRAARQDSKELILTLSPK